MKTPYFKIFLLCFTAIALAATAALAQRPLPKPQTANVAGKWTLTCKYPNGSTSTTHLELKQKGSIITGHFKGPDQSGGVDGTVDEQHLVLLTKTHDVQTFRGKVDGTSANGVVQGSTFNGNFQDRNGTCSFEGQRSN